MQLYHQKSALFVFDVDKERERERERERGNNKDLGSLIVDLKGFQGFRSEKWQGQFSNSFVLGFVPKQRISKPLPCGVQLLPLLLFGSSRFSPSSSLFNFIRVSLKSGSLEKYLSFESVLSETALGFNLMEDIWT